MNTDLNPMYRWEALPWRQIERDVFKLQKRIYRASARGDSQTVRTLQRLMINNRAAKLLAVRRVTQDNRGKNTAGVDGVSALAPEDRLELAEPQGQGRSHARCAGSTFPNRGVKNSGPWAFRRYATARCRRWCGSPWN